MTEVHIINIFLPCFILCLSILISVFLHFSVIMHEHFFQIRLCGNRKKVSIVCALQHMPKLCILDEPTSGLDPLMQREFYSVLEDRNAKGATICKTRVQMACNQFAQEFFPYSQQYPFQKFLPSRPSVRLIPKAHVKESLIKGFLFLV